MQFKLFAVALAGSVCMLLTNCSKNDYKRVRPGGNLQKLSSFTIANTLNNNMVIQRNKPLLVWGYANYGNNVTVKISWNNSTYNAITDSSGMWSVPVPVGQANASPQTITCNVAGYSSIVLSNILIGDVWICSGQSNMQYTVQGVTDSLTEIAAANYPQIRSKTLIIDSANTPADTLSRKEAWSVCSPSTVGSISAIAYFFARKLTTTLNVPIGIIISAVHGQIVSYGPARM